MHADQKPKKYKLLFFLLLSPVFLYGQSLTGLWTGSLSNDSNTVRKDQSFEIALTEYRGKVYGYSRSEFIVNDTLYYILKRVKGTIDGDVCEVTDDDIIAYNFPGKLDKGVKVTSTFKRSKEDSSWHLDGTWKTNLVKKKYYAITGKVGLSEDKDLTHSKIFPHLEELRLADQVAFYKEQKERVPIVAMRRVRPELVNTEYRNKPEIDIPAAEKVDIDKNALIKNVSSIEEKIATARKEEEDRIKLARIEEEKKQKQIDEEKIKLAQLENEKKRSALIEEERKRVVKLEDDRKKAIQQEEEKKKLAQLEVEKKKVKDLATTIVDPGTRDPFSKPDEKKIPVISDPLKTVVSSNKKIDDLILQTKTIGGRVTEFTQEVVFKSDSLMLSLYDNGEIDGDTVSVYINGEMVMARQGLKASAIKKTIYIKPGDNNDFTLVLFADNLGKYPPNTGLLVVYDGEDVYHLRFSSDLQKSSGIIFKRKK